MRELILILCYVPDTKRQELLRDLVNDIKNKNYDIMLTSHSYIPKDIFDNVNYVFYDKDNFLLTDIKHKTGVFYSNPSFLINTTEMNEYNHAASAFKLLTLGLTNAKNLGYEKIHMFEYDSRILQTIEIENNSKLLDEYNSVYYLPKNLPFPNSPVSYNIKNISNSFFDITNNGFLNFLNQPSSTRMAEQYHKILLDESEKSYEKTNDVLEKNGIVVSLNGVGHKRWAVCVFDSITNKMIFFSWGKNETNSFEVQLIINKNIYKTYTINPNVWMTRYLEDYDKIENIMIIIDNKIINYLDFSKIDKEVFKQRNKITYKN
jgi:hypothetical protein